MDADVEADTAVIETGWRSRFELIEDEPDAYRVFYRAGTSRSDVLIVTFSTSYQDISSKPFGEPFIGELGFGHLHFSQAKDSDFQYLSLEDFQRIAAPYVRNRTVITYGSSLGGYAAIYYAGVIGARAIAATPINLGHPLVAHLAQRKSVPIQHAEIVENPRSVYDPVIIYDDEIATDRLFVEACISPAYPNAQIHIIKHCGHGGALRVLKEIGELKSVLLALIEGRAVDLAADHFTRRFQETHQYRMERARFCLSQKMFEEAIQLARRLSEVRPSSRLYQILITALIKSGNKVEARRVHRQIIGDFPELAKYFPTLVARVPLVKRVFGVAAIDYLVGIFSNNYKKSVGRVLKIMINTGNYAVLLCLS
jgi:hypothetical protein